jgi:hypothetical protein
MFRLTSRAPTIDMPTRYFVIFVIIVLAATAGCANRPRTAPVPARLTWTGAFQPSRQRTSSAAVEQVNRVFGTVALTEAPDDPNRTRAQIMLNSSLQAGSTLGWSVAPGRCGSGALPLMIVTNFPPLEVGRAGRAELNQEFALTLPADEALHVDVYWTFQATNALNDVMTCANLTKNGRPSGA